MENSRVDKILEAIDSGLQTTQEPAYGETDAMRQWGVEVPAEPNCVRCARELDIEGEFCKDCRAFMLGDTDVDPTGRVDDDRLDAARLAYDSLIDRIRTSNFRARRGEFVFFRLANLEPVTDENANEPVPVRTVEVAGVGDLIRAVTALICQCGVCRRARGEDRSMLWTPDPLAGPLDLGIIRDPVAGRTNDLTMFLEEWLGFPRSELLTLRDLSGISVDAPDAGVQAEIEGIPAGEPGSLAEAPPWQAVARDVARRAEERLLQAMREPDADAL